MKQFNPGPRKAFAMLISYESNAAPSTGFNFCRSVFSFTDLTSLPKSPSPSTIVAKKKKKSIKPVGCISDYKICTSLTYKYLPPISLVILGPGAHVQVIP